MTRPGLCKKSLEVPTMAEHDGDLYCRQCYARKFGIRGVGFGIGAGALGMDTGDRYGNSQSQPSVIRYMSSSSSRSFSSFLDVDQVIRQCPEFHLTNTDRSTGTV